MEWRSRKKRKKNPQRNPRDRSVWSCCVTLAYCGAKKQLPIPTMISAWKCGRTEDVTGAVLRKPCVNIISCQHVGRINFPFPIQVDWRLWGVGSISPPKKCSLSAFKCGHGNNRKDDIITVNQQNRIQENNNENEKKKTNTTFRRTANSTSLVQNNSVLVIPNQVLSKIFTA